MRDGTVDESLKEALVEQFRAHLDALGGDDRDSDDQPEAMPDVDAGADLHSLFIEMAALRSEVRTESRLVKETLDLVRGVVERGRAEQVREREAAVLRPLLIDLIEVRDRLAAGVSGPAAAAPWYRRRLFLGFGVVEVWA